MRYLKQSTSVDLPIGPFLDSVDGVTAETGLTLTQPDIRLKKNGGAWAQKAAAQTLSHEENGWYEVTLDATDTDTLGQLMLAVHESGALPVWFEFMVMPANVWDSMFGADLLQVDAREHLGTAYATPTVAGVPEVDMTHLVGVAQSATDLKDFADDGYDPSTNKVQGVVLTDTVTTYTGNTPQTGDAFARLGAPAGASVSADVAAVKVDTGNLVTRIPAALFSGITSLAQWLGLLGGKHTGNTTARTELNATGAGSGTYDETQDSLEASRDLSVTHASGISDIQGRLPASLDSGRMNSSVNNIASSQLTAIAAGVWDRLTSALSTAGSIGKLIVDNLNATVSSRSTLTAADVNQEADTALADVGVTTTITGRIDAAISTRATPVQVNAEVVDALATDTYAEPTGAPSATATLAAKVNYLYMALRNKLTITSSTKTFCDDSGAAEWSKALSDDGTTYTEAEGA